MNRGFKNIFLALMLIVTVVFITACSNDKKEDKQADKKDDNTLIVGLDDTFAPMGFRDESNKLVGFDIDLANAVGEELGYKIKFKPINWDAKDLELKSKKIDCIWNGMSQTPEREKAMSLSKRYLENEIILMSNKDDVTVNTASDLSKYKLGTQADSSALEMLKANEAYDSFKDNITEYKTYDEALLDLKAGRVDVMVIDQVLGLYMKSNAKDDSLRALDYTLGDDYYVIGFRKEDEKLRNQVNGAIKALLANGKAKEISEKWFGENIVVFLDN